MPSERVGVAPEVLEGIKKVQLALLERTERIVNGNVDGDQGLLQLLASLLGQTTGQQGSQQSNQQATQQAAEIIAALTARTQTETSHTDDVNAVERIKAAVARGVDNNELASQRLNNIAGNVAEMVGLSLGILSTSASVASAQLQAQIPDHGAKNSDHGRK